MLYSSASLIWAKRDSIGSDGFHAFFHTDVIVFAADRRNASILVEEGAENTPKTLLCNTNKVILEVALVGWLNGSKEKC